MPSYFVTGVSRGLGYEFLSQLSSDSSNTVIGLVRDKSATNKKVSEDADLKDRTNIYILEADITDYKALKKVAEETAKITSGRLDYLIANAASSSQYSTYDGLGTLGANDPEGLEKDIMSSFKINVVGNIFLFSVFMPLVLKGDVKKVITIGSPMGNNDIISSLKIEIGGCYAVSKAAMLTTVAKFHAQYADDGVLFMSVAPGVVDTGNAAPATEEQQKVLYALFGKFASMYPHFTGPITAEESIKLMLNVVKNASLAKGDGGSFLSQFGNKQWL